MYSPAAHDEITTLRNYADQQLEAIRAAAFGLTAEEFRSTPCRSALSIASLVKHTAYGLHNAARRLTADPMTPPELDEASFAEYGDSFAVTDADPEELLRDFDTGWAELRSALDAVDPDAGAVDPPAPWHGVMEPQPIRWRYYLVHMIEELARHAGHADIIREQIDGQAVPSLVLTLAGAPANAYFTPFDPPPGTIGA